MLHDAILCDGFEAVLAIPETWDFFGTIMASPQEMCWNFLRLYLISLEWLGKRELRWSCWVARCRKAKFTTQSSGNSIPAAHVQCSPNGSSWKSWTSWGFLVSHDSPRIHLSGMLTQSIRQKQAIRKYSLQWKPKGRLWTWRCHLFEVPENQLRRCIWSVFIVTYIIIYSVFRSMSKSFFGDGWVLWLKL